MFANGATVALKVRGRNSKVLREQLCFGCGYR